MKNILISLMVFMSTVSAWSQKYELVSKTCNTKIAVTMQVTNPQTRIPGQDSTIAEWFTDATGARPSGFGKGQEKLKYDGVRAILNQGYKLTPVLANSMDLSSANEGDIFLLVKLFCSADLAGAFCSTAVIMQQATSTDDGKLVAQTVARNSSGGVVDGTSQTVLYKSLQVASKLLPTCVVK